MAITADFETGTHGNTIATGDTGSATAWNGVTIGAGATVKYDNVSPAHGTLAAKFVHVGSVISYLEWTTAFGTQTDHYGRFYFMLGTAPASFNQALDIVQWLDGTTSSGLARINTSGKLIAVNNDGTATTAGTTTLAISTLYRVEYHVVHSATVGSVQLVLYAGDSASALETITRSATNTLTQSTRMRIGTPLNAMSNFTLYLDDIVAAANAFPGPYAATVQPGRRTRGYG